MALVMAVAALDTYMHGIVLRRLSNVRGRSELPKALGKVEMPFEEFASLADATISAQRSHHRGRPWVQVKNALQSVLLEQTFQKYDQVSRAFALAGIKECWSKVANELGESPDTIRDRLNALVHRRNQIVHEGDMARNSRPRKLKFNELHHGEIRSEVTWIKGLIDAMEVVIAAEP